MSSDKFEFILLEMPNQISHELIERLRVKAYELKAEEAININSVIDIDISGLKDAQLREDDLFEIGDQSLAIKKSVQDFLNEAISRVVLPRMYEDNRISSPLCLGEFSYVTIEKKNYVIAGQVTGYYGTKDSLGFKYVLSLSLSNILSEFL